MNFSLIFQVKIHVHGVVMNGKTKQDRHENVLGYL